MTIDVKSPRRAFLVGVLGIFACSGLQAQTEAQWVTITYVKTEPGKAQEFRKFVETNWKKLAQVGVDEGRTRGAFAMRLTAPYATGAPFDYALVNIMAKRPSLATTSQEELDARAKKAGLASYQQYLDSATPFGKVVKSEWMTASMRVGNLQAGNYNRIMRYEVAREHRQEVMRFLREYTLPLNTDRIKDGPLAGFGVHVPAMVTPEEAGYAMSVSFIVKDADAAMAGPAQLTEERFKRALPGKSYAAYMNQLNTINGYRKPVATRIYEVVSVVGTLPAVTPPTN